VNTKEQLHTLVDMLPDAEVLAASRFLQFLVNDTTDEPLTEEDWREVREGQAAIGRGDFTTLEDVKRELNL